MSEIRKTNHVIKGMNKDLSRSKISNELSWENRNIRLIATNTQSTFAIINELGNKKIDFVDKNNNKILLEGRIIGKSNINSLVVIFTTDNGIDRIYSFDAAIDTFILTLHYEGELNFSDDYPIETIGWYENENVIKVYWIDGLNLPKYINLMEDYKLYDVNNNPIGWKNPNLLSFLIEYSLDEPSVTKYFPQDLNADFSGLHEAGVVQYAYNFYYENGGETKLSPLSEIHYISLRNKGNEVNEFVPCSFKIQVPIKTLDFFGVKVYRFKRTTLDQIPTITLIYDEKLKEGGQDEIFIDTGQESLNIITPAALEVIGGTYFIPNTFEQKDNRLFYSNYTTKSFSLLNLDIDLKTNVTLTIQNRPILIDAVQIRGIPVEQPNGSMPRDSTTEQVDTSYWYKNIAAIGDNNYVNGYETYNAIRDINSDYATFKRNETYRFGLQVQSKYGIWSDVRFIKDVKFDAQTLGSMFQAFYKVVGTTIFPSGSPRVKNLDYIFANYLYLEANLSPTLISRLSNMGFIRYRIMRVQRNEQNSTILSQGIVCGTSFEKITRNTLTWGCPDWFVRNLKYENYRERFDVLRQTAPYGPIKSFLKLNRPTALRYTSEKEDGSDTQETQITCGEEFLDNHNEALDAYSEASNYVSHIPCSDSHILNFYSPEVSIPNKNNYPLLSGTNINIIGNMKFGWTSTDLIWNAGIGSAEERDRAKVSNVVRGYRDRLIVYLGNYGEIRGGSDNSKDIRWGDPYVGPTWVKNLITALHTTGEDGSVRTANKHISYFRYMECPNISSDQRSLLDEFDDKKYAGEDIGIINLNITGGGIDNSIRYDSMIDYNFPVTVVGMMFNHNGNKQQMARDVANTSFKSKIAKHVVFGLPHVKNIDGTYNPDQAPALIEPDREVKTWYSKRNGNIQTPFYVSAFKTYNMQHLYDKEAVYICELTRTNTNQYGDPNIVESQYIPCSNTSILANKVKVDQGDIFLQRFDLLRTSINNVEEYQTLSETVSFLLESTINLDKRFDTSRTTVDHKFSTPNKFYGYNPVYDQQNNFIKGFQLDSKYKEVTNYPNTIITTEEKLNGNLVDNWSHIVPNENMTLEGRYGSISKLISLNSYMYAFQNKATCSLLINPRVQVAPSDGVPIELGTGKLFDTYRYLSTNQGTSNKWGVIKTSDTIYFYDDLNSSLNKLGEGIQDFSTDKGFHSYLEMIGDTFRNKKNPLKDGIFGYYHNNNNEIYYIFKNKDTLVFNENTDSFTSFYDYNPSIFIDYRDKYITNSFNGHLDELYSHFDGEYNNFYGKYYPSIITPIINADPASDKVFNNIEWTGEFYDKDGKDVMNQTITHIKAWNEYQTTADTKLKFNDNLRRRFRIWRTYIPRMISNNNPTLSRMRGTNMFLELKYDPNVLKDKNNRILLHDIITSYTI